MDYFDKSLSFVIVIISILISFILSTLAFLYLSSSYNLDIGIMQILPEILKGDAESSTYTYATVVVLIYTYLLCVIHNTFFYQSDVACGPSFMISGDGNSQIIKDAFFIGFGGYLLIAVPVFIFTIII